MTALISPTSVPHAGRTDASTAVLDITAGLHRGVSLALAQPEYLLGSAAGADLLLSDAGVAERHVLLRLERDWVAIEARGADVLVSDLRGPALTVPMGRGHRARLPLELGIGAARLRLSRDPAASVARAPLLPSRSTGQWLCAALFMGLCAAAFGSFGLHRDGPGPSAATARSGADGPLALGGATTAGHPATLANAEQAQQWLAEQLQAAHISTIAVDRRDAGLSARGQVSAAQRADWTQVQQAYDSRFGQAVVLHPQVSVSSVPATPRVRFQAVFFGPQPYVVSDAGKRLYPGAALADDWRLERIENNQVILARGAERFTFTL